MLGKAVGNGHQERLRWRPKQASVQDQGVHLAGVESKVAIVDQDRARSTFRILREPCPSPCYTVLYLLSDQPMHLPRAIRHLEGQYSDQGFAVLDTPDGVCREETG